MSEPGGDPFLHHPALRGRILDPATSFFRSFRPADLDARMAELGHPARLALQRRGARGRAPGLPRRPPRPRPLGLRLRLADVGPGHPLRRGPARAGGRLCAPVHPQGHLRRPRHPRGARPAGGARCRRGLRRARLPHRPGRDRGGERLCLAPRASSPRSTGRSSSRPPPPPARSKPWQRWPTTPRRHPRRSHPRRAGALPRHRRGHARHQPAYIENLAGQFAALGIEDPEVASLLAEARAYAGTALTRPPQTTRAGSGLRRRRRPRGCPPPASPSPSASPAWRCRCAAGA